MGKKAEAAEVQKRLGICDLPIAWHPRDSYLGDLGGETLSLGQCWWKPPAISG